MAAKRKASKGKPKKAKGKPGKAKGKPKKAKGKPKKAKGTSSRPTPRRAKKAKGAKKSTRTAPATKAGKRAAKPARAKARPVRGRATRPARPVRGASRLGRFVWHDLMTGDVPKAIEFYGRVFGWTATALDDGTYHRLAAAGVHFGGMLHFAQARSHWMPYVSVNDVEAACATAKRQGGVVCVPPTPIPGIGRFAVVADPLGAVTSPLQTKRPPRQDPDAPVPMGLVVWNELVTPDPSEVTSFYGALYGWSNAWMDMGPMGTYTIFRSGDKDIAGMTKPAPGAPAGVPPGWLTYFHVDDVEATLAKAVAAGATANGPAFDVPGIGRMAFLSDPGGARFALFKPLPRSSS